MPLERHVCVQRKKDKCAKLKLTREEVKAGKSMLNIKKLAREIADADESKDSAPAAASGFDGLGANPLSANQIIKRAAASIPVMGQLAKSATTAVNSNLVSTGMVDLKLAMQALLIGVIVAFICGLYCGCTWRRVPRQVTTSSIPATVGNEPREPYIAVHFSDDSIPESAMPTRQDPLATPEVRNRFRENFPNLH